MARVEIKRWAGESEATRMETDPARGRSKRNLE